MTIFELQARSKNLIPEEVRRKAIVDESKNVIKDFQELQLDYGFVSENGIETRLLYNDDDYAGFKLDVVNPKAKGFVDLKYEGDFYKGMYLDLTSDGMKINSTDWKTKHLTKKYGNNIFELSDKTAKRNAINYVIPRMTQIAKEILGL